MKKRILTLLTVLICTCALLTGCDSEAVDSLLGGGSSSGSSSSSSSRSSDSSTSSENASGEIDWSNSIGGTNDDYYEGRLGSVMKTAFFDYVITDASITDTYQGVLADSGMIFVVCDVTIKNTFGGQVPMWIDDFYIHWGSDDDDELAPPEALFVDGEAIEEYYLKRAEVKSSTMVFEVPNPNGENEYGISFVEIFEDDSVGEYFMIYFELDSGNSL